MQGCKTSELISCQKSMHQNLEVNMTVFGMGDLTSVYSHPWHESTLKFIPATRGC